VSRLGGQDGFTLVESVVAAAMLVVVLGATLVALDEFRGTTRVNTLQTQAQDEARRTVSGLATELRNLASPTDELPEAVEKATPSDLVFQSVADVRPSGSQNVRNTRRVRYCLDAASSTLWRQEQTWTTAGAPALPATTSCPAPATQDGWAAGHKVAEHVTNGTRAVFTYNASDLQLITEVHVKLYVDVNPGARPAESQLETGVFLRNQNRPPSASFTATPSGAQVVLNGSESSDPEGRALRYQWYADGSPIGEGILFTYQPAQGGPHSITLTVSDPAGLTATAPAQTVCVVTGGATCP
jgi:type II secretory pathway pseudopilin PulG